MTIATSSSTTGKIDSIGRDLSPHPVHFPAKDSLRRVLGAFYTPKSVADFIADWVVRNPGEHLLEPSFGDGIFLRAVAESAERHSISGVRLFGVEIDEAPLRRVLQEELISRNDVFLSDFLNLRPFPVHGVLGNPPYVRLRQLEPAQRQNALDVALTVMGDSMDPSGSLWLPFLLHSMRFLESGGRLAFVLPYELTYVRYARPLWNALRQSFGSITVLRTHQRPFPEILQDVVILLADEYGSQTDVVRFQAYERVDELFEGNPTVDEAIAIDDLVHGKRSFISALLGPELRELLNSKVSDETQPAKHSVQFNIGYVAGDKSFFHPESQTAEEFKIPPESLRPTLTSTRAMRGAGLRTSSLGPNQRGKLFLPEPAHLTAGEQEYIAHGVQVGVSSRYKCRIRDPWFLVPGVKVPDVVVSVFSERPTLMINDARCFASNSLLCGYSLGPTSQQLATAWYSSLTLLQCELEIHALGGGVMVLIPGEAGRIRLPKQVQAEEDHLGKIDAILRSGSSVEAYREGDVPVLGKQLGFREEEIALIRHGVDVLAHWRTSARSSRQ